MVEIKRYHLPSTKLIPNSPWPLLHYSNVFADETTLSPAQIHDVFSDNGWQTQWIFRYGATQRSHYHSATHECMAVLSGTATIRFGVADVSPDLEDNTYGNAQEEGGIEVEAHAGDVFVLPAGLAHKTFDTKPSAEFTLLTPGDGHHVAAQDIRGTLANIQLSGFTMIGAYPLNGGAWDFAQGGEDVGNFEKVWHVPKPDRDPVLGNALEGLCGQWQ